ncbi:MAG: hypothetical protein ACR2OZ_19195 [Verrucomicrobiales bacterium]
MTLREEGVVGFDRASMLMHAGKLTLEGSGHGGIILFRRSLASTVYGKQARLLVDIWADAREWDWADRIEYVPHDQTLDHRHAV